jgi:23S rRNA pseudouridine1911/1915/1917 synthase
MKKIDYNDIVIIYEDNHLLVVLKPQGLPCCPDSSESQNLLDLLKQYLIDKNNKPGDAYLGLVHRLDQPTGGVIMYAKSSKAASRLSKSLREKSISKKYLAILVGVPKQKKATLKNSLYKDEAKNEVYCVPMATEGAKTAELEYKVLATSEDGLSLVEINLITGRSHQARVQMANIGTPIWGDQKYGKATGKANLALWAVELRFPHPTKEDIMVFRVFPPDEEPWTKFDIASKLAIIK